MKNNQQKFDRSSCERGFVLPIGIVLLLSLSITAFAVAKTALYHEKMARSSKEMVQELMAAESAISIAEAEFAAKTDLTGEVLLDSECGLKEIIETVGYSTVRTIYYNPPPNGTNWGDGDGTKVLICHKYQNNLVISVNAVGVDGTKHTSHEGDYLGECINGSISTPDDPWKTCTDKYGTTAKRLSWQQLYEM